MHIQLLKLVRVERRITTKILNLLQEVSDQKLYIDWGYSSLYEYLTRGLGYSEAVAYQRQSALKIIKEIPEVKAQLEKGSLNFSSLTRAYKALKGKPLATKQKIIQQLENKSAREVEKILIAESPNFNLASKKRYVSSNIIRITIDLTETEYEEVVHLRALKSHAVNSDRDLFLGLVRQASRKYQNTKLRMSKSLRPRQIAQSTKNHLLKQAEYRCQYIGCNQTHFLQIDHKRPVRWGGGKEIQNLQVLCSTHNQSKG